MSARLLALVALAAISLQPAQATGFDLSKCKDEPYWWWCPGGKADPVFWGFDKSTFLFLGKKDHFYSLVSSADTQLNMMLVDAELPEGSDLAKLHPGKRGTFMASYGLSYMDQRIEVEVDRLGVLTSVKLNGTEQLTAENDMRMGGDLAVSLPQEVDVSIMRFRPYYGQSVFVQTPDFDYLMYPTLAYFEETTGEHIRGHLNLQIGEVHLHPDQAAHVGGLLGVTLRNAHPDPITGESSASVTDFDALAEIKPFSRPEGEEAYEVASLFGRPAFDPSLWPASRMLVKAARRLRVLA